MKKNSKNLENGYIYVVRVDKYYKIGKTSNPSKRLGEYTKLYFEPKTLACELVVNYHNLEKRLHEIFKDKRIRGEWFRLNWFDLRKIRRILKKHLKK